MNRQFKALNIQQWIEQNKENLQPPVNNKVMFEDSSTIVMMVGGPNRRRDFHISPAEEIFFQIKGSCYVEIINDEQKRQVVEVKEGEMFLLPGNVPHSPHRVADTYGIVIEERRDPGATEHLVWFCDKCDNEMHRITLELTNIEKQLKTGIENFNKDEELRTCHSCGHVMPEEVAVWTCE